MGTALGVYGTLYKVKKTKNLLWGKIWPAYQIVRTRVILLYQENQHKIESHHVCVKISCRPVIMIIQLTGKYQ